MPRPVDPLLRQRILSTARAQFFAHGFYRVSVDDLVAELRASKATIYRHFKSKQAIVQAVLAEFNEARNAELAAIIADQTLAFADKLAAVTAASARSLSQVNDRFYDDLRIHYPSLWADYEASRQFRLDTFYRRLFEEGVVEGVMRSDVNLDFMLLAYTKLTELVIRPKSLPISLSDAYQLVTTLFLQGVVTELGRAQLNNHE